jgi:hypothetical protein
MHDNALTGNLALLEDVPCAIIPSQFVRSWRQWLARPTDAARPETIDNSQFICEHEMLTFNPNIPMDLDTSIAIVKRADWDILEELCVSFCICNNRSNIFNRYSGGPLISLENCLVEDEADETHFRHKFVHDIPVCTGCRQRRLHQSFSSCPFVLISLAENQNSTLQRSPFGF